MFHNFSQQSVHFRVFQTIVNPAHEYSVRYCNIDYDRELAIVAEIEEDGKRKMLGVVRINLSPSEKSGEISFIVTDSMQGQGLGSKMVDYMIEISKDKKLEIINAIMLPDNYKAIKLLHEMGFTIESMDDGTQRATLELT